MTAQRAARALRMIVMSPRQPIVGEQQHAALEAFAESADPRREPQIQLRGVTIGKRAQRPAEDRGAAGRERALRLGLGVLKGAVRREPYAKLTHAAAP